MTFNPLLLLYTFVQWLIDKLISPTPPPPNARLRRPRIAVIGAGLTGVSAASHIVGHGFDVTIFEAGSRERLGGIWSRVNSTSGLQIHSLMYRFHPKIRWNSGYPLQNTIVEQITKLWDLYGLEDKTKFNTPVRSVKPYYPGPHKTGKPRWVINDNEDQYGYFDGVIAAVGTCGDPKMPPLPDQDKFKGQVFHSTELDGKDAKDKRIIIVGGGASAVEALEFAHKAQAREIVILSRSEKWIIPRNAIVDMGLSMNVFGQETMLSFVPEFLLRKFFYRDLEDISPPKDVGIFTETPMVNTEVLNLIRSGKAKWLRGDTLGFTEDGMKFNRRAKGVPKNGPGHEEDVKGDMVIMATGFKRPTLSFLPPEIFDEPYTPPNWYLQTFPPDHLTICANNCTYVNAIGTVGNWHIGIYTRILLMFLVDPLTTPKPWWSKRWIDMTKWLKLHAPGGAFDFFTYAELLWWFVFCIAINPFRWKWALFVFFGVGRWLPMAVVEREDRYRAGGFGGVISGGSSKKAKAN